MRDNSNLTVVGDRVILVPYRREHVQRYHEWMQDTALQEATASEPLTLEEEFEMQEDWAKDPQKCTFILLDPNVPDTPGTGQHGGGMAGDVNMYWNDHDDHTVAEIHVMVAEPASRRKGLAAEALELFMAYAASKLGVTRFRAKIGEANTASRALFAKLGYAEVGTSAVFQEVTLELGREDERWNALMELAGSLHLASYDAE